MSGILVTGGAGYIGSHVCAVLMAAGYRVVVLDNLANSSLGAINALNEMGQGQATFVEGDCRDEALVDAVFGNHEITGVIHLAGLKAVAESVADPVHYYSVNLGSAATVLQAMQRHGVQRMVFSSSATVYGDPDTVPTPESAPTNPLNPYGWSKLMIEQMLRDLSVADPSFQAVSLRYFNPVGAHPSGLIGEDPRNPPQNLFPIIARTAIGQRPSFEVFGDDWDTPDGSCIRDYIHVMDLAEGHLAALRYLDGADASTGHAVINLGTGLGCSVFGALAAFGDAAGKTIPHKVSPRRPGDAPRVVADTKLALRLLGWQATRDLSQMCRDQWNWEKTRSLAPATDTFVSGSG